MKRNLLLVAVLLVLFYSVVNAAETGLYTPHGCVPKAFSPEANYLSSEGNIRLGRYLSTGVWIPLASIRENCYILKFRGVRIPGWKPTDPGFSHLNANELQPFSRETNYMSVEGFARWYLYLNEKRWLPAAGLKVVSVN